MGPVRSFLSEHYLHFNARTVVDAAQAWEDHLQAGGKMMVSLAGAMSTARIGKTLARLIRQDLVHAISCTGANLEEDIFALLAHDDYEHIPNWRALRAEDEAALLERGMNRVTDVCIPETVMRHVKARLLRVWQQASQAGEGKLPAEHLFEILKDKDLAEHFQLSAEESWVVAAKESSIPVFTPGWEDSTLGNMFTSCVRTGELPDHRCVLSGTEQMDRLVDWYLEEHQPAPGIGFFQVGGGIAGDFAICAVPLIRQDLKRDDVPLWGYFCQISDAVSSYGGYSGAPPNEKITWGKLDVDTPRFMIQSDATIVAPLIFAWLLDD